MSQPEARRCRLGCERLTGQPEVAAHLSSLPLGPAGQAASNGLLIRLSKQL